MSIYLHDSTSKFANISAKILLKSCVFFIFLYVLDIFFRAVFIINLGVFKDNLGAATQTQILQAFINGSRYFGQIIGVLSLIVFVLLLMCECKKCKFIFHKILRIFIAFVICLVCFVNIANMGFYEIYGDVFNANLLGLIFDDRAAIFDTAFAGDYHLSVKIMAWIVSSVIFIKISNIIFRKIDSFNGGIFWAFLLFLVFGFASLFAINGTFGLKGISLGANIKPVTNTFLRQISTGAFRDLYIVFIGYKRISNSKFSDYIDETPLQTARNFSKKQISGEVNLLDVLSKYVDNKTLESNVDSNISHIFYIIAESLSQWHFDSIFDEIDLSSELKRLINQNNAFKADIFLQNAGSTIKSLDVQISGLLQTDIPLSLLTGKIDELAFAPAVIAKDLGYNGIFFYGGSGTWQKLDSYVTTQGFSEILFSTHIIQNAKENGYSEPFSNSWGAFDNYLFAFVKDKIIQQTKQNPSHKSFNMIMTTSNHPPYNVPLEQFNAPMERIQSFIDSNKSLRIKPISAKILAHIWWQDKVIAKFINEMSAIFPNSLFIITGDHYDREYPFSPASLKVQQGVPFIVYSPRLHFQTIANVGSHIDIMPTIINLVAPNNYKYHSFGKPMLKNANPQSGIIKILQDEQDSTALGFVSIANDRFIYDGFKIEYFNDKKMPNDDNLAKMQFKQLNRAKALSWWILKNGYKIPADKSED